MSAAIAPWLAVILFLPAFAILAGLYWLFPQGLPRTPARRRFDLAALAVSTAVTVGVVLYTVSLPRGAAGPIWPQVFASLAAFHSFPFLLGLAFWWRQRRFAPR